MRLTYQTGIAALIHLVVITLLNVANGVFSSVKQCTTDSSDCLSNIILSLLYFIVITGWFIALWLLASGAQVRRSRKLALLLIAAEGMVFIISLFNALHHNGGLGLITSVVDATLAVWVAWLALRIVRSGGTRVPGSVRSRQRRLNKD